MTAEASQPISTLNASLYQNDSLQKSQMNRPPSMTSTLKSNEEGMQDLLDLLSARIKDQELTKGNASVLYFSVLTIGLGFVTTLVASPANFLPLIMTALPGTVLLIYTLSGIKDKMISSAIVFEFLWMGAIFSVLFGCLLEMVALGVSHGVSVCSLQVEHPSLACDGFFIIVFILCVGFSEELAKMLPIARITTKKEGIFLRVRWWHRYVDNPAHFVLFAVSSAIGFATLENIKYVFMIEKDATMMRRFAVASMRAVLSVPLHYCCTGIAACVIAMKVFKYKEDFWETHQLTFGSLALALGVPSVLHGMYDAFIFIAIKSPPNLNDASEVVTTQAFRYLPSWASLDLALASCSVYIRRLAGGGTSTDYNVIWAETCAFSVLCVYLATVGYFSYVWRKVLRLESIGLGAITKHRRECPILGYYTDDRLTNVAQPLLISPRRPSVNDV